MQYHPEAALTVHQRRALHDDYHQRGLSIKDLTAKYQVATKTVQKWIHRDTFTDRSSAPHRRRSHRPPA